VRLHAALGVTGWAQDEAVVGLDDIHRALEAFFDVFAEISLDGETWSPSVDSFRIVQGVPEPTAWLLALLTTPIAWRYRHRS